MDQREYLVKAREADVIANAAGDPRERHRWEDIAVEYRRLAKIVEAQQRYQARSFDK